MMARLKLDIKIDECDLADAEVLRSTEFGSLRMDVFREKWNSYKMDFIDMDNHPDFEAK